MAFGLGVSACTAPPGEVRGCLFWVDPPVGRAANLARSDISMKTNDLRGNGAAEHFLSPRKTGMSEGPGSPQLLPGGP